MVYGCLLAAIQSPVVHQNRRLHHESIHEGVTAVRQLASGIILRWTGRTMVLSLTTKHWRTMRRLFLNTTGNVLNDEQQAAFENSLSQGRVCGNSQCDRHGIRLAVYTRMVGMMFKIHPQQQTAYLKVEDSNFPGMERFPKKLLWTDEWYDMVNARPPISIFCFPSMKKL